MSLQAPDSLSVPVPRASRSQLRYRQTLMQRSTVLPESEPSCSDSTSSQAFHQAEPSVASTRGRKRRTDDILRSYEMGSCSTDYSLPDLQQGIGSEDNCTIQMPTSSRRTRRRISSGATSATADLTTQCLSRHKRTVFSPLHLGGPNHVCPYCGALFWNEERVHGRGGHDMPIYNKCCRGGSIVLPSYKTPPEPLLGLLNSSDTTLSNHFFDGIRCYNSMFAMTSMGVHVISSVCSIIRSTILHFCYEESIASSRIRSTTLLCFPPSAASTKTC